MIRSSDYREAENDRCLLVAADLRLAVFAGKGKPVTTEQKTWTVGELLNWTAAYLAQKGVEFPRLDAEVLLAHALECKRIDLYGFRFNDVADGTARQRYKDLIRRRLEGCPVAYLVGRKEFFGLEFEVSSAVLIPRPDSETVATECLALAKKIPQPRVVDIGTGSGNLAISVAHQHPGAQVTAVDVSPEALEISRRNANRHGVAARMRFFSGDLFAPLPPEERFDFVLSNPPYIPREDLDKLPVGVRHYEPCAALDGGPGGFAVFERLVNEARAWLEPGGHLLVEIGAPQETEARRRISACQEYELAGTIRDYSGHPRVLRARLHRPPALDNASTHSQE
jgi:release factor glutamine methyltransferase